MTEKQLIEKLTKLVKVWSEKLGIGDYKYQIRVVPGSKLKKTYAEVLADSETREAFITFNKTRMFREPNQIEVTVVHELLHVRFDEAYELSEEIIKSYVKPIKTRRMITKQLDKAEHKIIVALSDALVNGVKH